MAARVEFTQDQLKEMCYYLDGVLYWKDGIHPHKKNRVLGNFIKDKRGYYWARLKVGEIRKNYFIHRLIFLYHNGYLPLEIDHIDRDKTNNKIENLRNCNHSGNAINQIRVNKTGFRGVYFNKGVRKKPWRVMICVNRKSINIGTFETKELAAAAYNSAAIEHHGEYAILNKFQ